MLHVSTDINRLIAEPAADPDFPHAPLDWTRESAEVVARAEGLALTDDHWETVRALQTYYAQHADDTVITLRELHDALNESFHHKGGLRYLYALFPGGPVAQACRIAGLKPPFTAVDRGFGSVA